MFPSSEQGSKRAQLVVSKKMGRSGEGVHFLPPSPAPYFSHSHALSRAFGIKHLLLRLHEPVNVCLPFSLFAYWRYFRYSCVLPIFCVTVIMRYLCVNIYVFYLYCRWKITMST